QREREAQHLSRSRWVALGRCAPEQRSYPQGNQPQNARTLLSFCSNDYLGLANHPALTDALLAGVGQWAGGAGASHLVSGHTQAHADLEDRLSTWMRPFIPNAQAISFCTGYMANLALMTTLGSREASIFADKLCHASIIDGALLAQAQFQRYPHGRLDVLQSQLERCTTPIKLIATDTVFSMDGDLADLPALLGLAERFDAWLMVDDAHGFGVLGQTGRGTLEHFALSSSRLMVMGTLGKAAGLAGAFVAADPVIVNALIQSARSYIYTTAQPPALAHALLTSLALIESEEGTQRRTHLATLISTLRDGLSSLLAQYPQAGWRLAPSNTPIQPLIVGHNQAALDLADALGAQGIRVPAIRQPTVPAGSARLRISLSAAHRLDDVQRLLQALAKAMA
ncbi:MAG TPA: 8-amino-7-oxononanoate synthase, partial [Burkholderiaceae bacterium]|nr:8-amino-7-oxononanoate synthase [Burkholderiaceae bacterium]